MLNELLSIERGLTAAGITPPGRHPSIKDVGLGSTIRVRLSATGAPVSLELIDSKASANLWTQRDGQQNSFPFVKCAGHLLDLPSESGWRDAFDREWKQKNPAAQRAELRALLAKHGLDAVWIGEWPGTALKQALHDRLVHFSSLRTSDARSVPIVVDRFLLACAAPGKLFAEISRVLLREIEEGSEDWVEAAHQALVGKSKKFKGKYEYEGARLYFDIPLDEISVGVSEPSNTEAMDAAITAARKNSVAVECALSGRQMLVFDDNFHQPNLPILGQTYLFSRNKDTPAAGRYGRFASDAFVVGYDSIKRLDGAAREITADHREGITWRGIPGEKPKQTDLLLAFVEAAPDSPVASMLAANSEEEDGEGVDHVAAFEMQSARVVHALQAKIQGDFRATPVQICVLRKVDQGTHKSIYGRRITVAELFDAADAWARGTSNLPPWLELPVSIKGKKGNPKRRPPSLAPLQLVAITRRHYIRGGVQQVEAVGIPAREVMAIFLNEVDRDRVRTVLSMLLRLYAGMLSGLAQGLRRGAAEPKKLFDVVAALRALSIFGVLLFKIGRQKEIYMKDAASNSAFRLGQFLAAADVVHVGYCADMRKGQVPPTLIGNAVLAMAQSNPKKALAVLSRRWKPYDGWAKRAQFESVPKKVRSKPKDQWRDIEWAILRGASTARRMNELGRELHDNLPERTDEAFKAELLLGYVAGLPSSETDKEHNEGKND